MPTAALLSELDAALKTLPFGTKPAELYDPMRYILDLGGKRFRPLLTLLAAGMAGGESAMQAAMPAALAVEIFHNFTLMHDDIMDKAPLRRGKPTVHKVWDEPTAILSGDGMLVVAYQTLLGLPQDKLTTALHHFNQCALGVVEGQQLDMNYERLPRLTEAEYLEMIRLKTAVLVGFALWLGAYVGGASQAEANAFYTAGVEMGLGFQLMDDYLDTFGQAAQVGKQIGGDILAGKKTFLLVSLQNHLDEAGQNDLQKAIALPDPTTKIATVQALIQSAGVDQACLRLSEQYFNQGKTEIERLASPSPLKEAVLTLAQQLMRRDR